MTVEQHRGEPRAEQADATEASRARALWRTTRASPMSAWRVARLHLGSGWRMLLAVGFGILVAVVLVATVPLYSALVGNVQLQATLYGDDPIARDVEIQAPGNPLTPATAQAYDSTLRPIASRALSAITQADITRYYTANTMLLSSVAGHPVEAGANVGIDLLAYDYAQALPHMHLVSGSVPRPPASSTGALAPDLLVTQQMAQDQHLHVGDALELEVRGNPAEVAGGIISGIWIPRQVDDPFWNGRTFEAVGTDAGIVYPVMMDPQAFLSSLHFSEVETREHWVYYTIPSHITTANLADVQNSLGALKTQLTDALQAQGANNVLILSNLARDLADQQARANLLSQPLYIVTLQVLGLALLFVVAMAGLLIEGQSAEIATLRSRGAGRTQMLASYAILGLLLAVVAAIAGVWLAGQLAVALIGWLIPSATLATAHITTGYLASLATPATAALPAIGGALLGEGAVVLAAQRAGQLDILSFRREQGRSSHQSVWRRYYIDLQIAVVCLLAYLDLSQFGGLGVREAVGGATSSPVLLLAPGLLLLAGALILLRVLPYGVQLGLRLVSSQRRGATGMLAFAQVARNPAAPSRLMLLLALAIGLGLFALTFDASLTHNAADRASYQTGADFRLLQQSAEPGVMDQRIESRLRGLPGVQDVSPVYRDRAFTTFTQGGASVNVLAVDPATWAQTAAAISWRSDYASASPAALMATLQAHQWGARDADRAGQTSAGEATHPIYAYVSQSFANALGLKVGAQTPLVLGNGNATNTLFVVGGIVQDVPTMYPAQAEDGFIVVNLNDYLGALTINSPGFSATSVTANSVSNSQYGPNEYWLRTTSDPRQLDTLRRTFIDSAPELDLAHVVDRRAALIAIASNPIAAGMRGQLLLGAFIAAALAVLGSVVQSAIAARQRTVQFAVLRTLGMTTRQLTRVLLDEQLIVYGFGLIGGTILGALLATTTLPFLQFGDTTLDPSQVGVPPLVISANPLTLAAFYAVLVVAFLVALLIAARYSGRVRLSRAMRLGED